MNNSSFIFQMPLDVDGDIGVPELRYIPQWKDPPDRVFERESNRPSEQSPETKEHVED
jgi:hypothetical protein